MGRLNGRSLKGLFYRVTRQAVESARKTHMIHTDFQPGSNSTI